MYHIIMKLKSYYSRKRNLRHYGRLDMSIRLPIYLTTVNKYHNKNHKNLDVTKKDK